MPEAFADFRRGLRPAGTHYRDMQDLEFTIERGKLWMLQTRSGKRTAKAALKIAVDMAAEGLISEEEAVARIDPASLDQLLHPTIDPARASATSSAPGLPASPGAATGEIVFTSEGCRSGAEVGGPQGHSRAHRDQPGRHSRHARCRRHPDHPRRHDQPCGGRRARHGQALRFRRGFAARRLCAMSELIAARRQTLKKGDVITIDGSSGQVLKGAIPMLQPELSGDFGQIMEWADRTRRMKVRTNAETPADARAARSFGAEGIGLCRTEHMFFDGAASSPCAR
jgi:pyruvate,orthophosphate dikinase